jgi:hypothetical protein
MQTSKFPALGGHGFGYPQLSSVSVCELVIDLLIVLYDILLRFSQLIFLFRCVVIALIFSYDKLSCHLYQYFITSI